MFTAFGLLATNGVLERLFAGGPTPDRVRAALPSLLLVAGAAALRAGLLSAAGWAQLRLKPLVERLAETRLFRLTTRVELTAFDDDEFHNAMQRARDSGVPDSVTVVEMTINVLNGSVGVAAAAATLGVLHPRAHAADADHGRAGRLGGAARRAHALPGVSGGSPAPGAASSCSPT